jgi:hypothetical protein
MSRPEARRAAALLVLLAAGPPAAAQDPATAIEMAGHRALAATRAAPGATLAPFTTDGCSGGLSHAWALVAAVLPAFAATHGDRPPWETCCVAHDRAYHLGGADPDPASSFEARRAADAALGDCVRAAATEAGARLSDAYGLTVAETRGLYDAAAAVMVAAVRAGGGPCSGLSWRWGYGWPQCGPFAGP